MRAEMVRHIETWKSSSGAEVGMHGKEVFAEVRGTFEVGEEVEEEVVGIGETRV